MNKQFFLAVLFIFFFSGSTMCKEKNDVTKEDNTENTANPSENTQNSKVFREDFNGTSIDESVWTVATWAEHGGQCGKERCFVKDGYLNMQFINDNGTFLSSAIQSKQEFLYGKWEVRLKASSVPGVLNSFYTIDWDDATTAAPSDGTKQEIDIEFLTFAFKNGKGKVHYAFHESGLRSFDTNPDIDVDFDPSADFHVWGFNVTPEKTEWFVDGKVIQVYEYLENRPKASGDYWIKLNFWSAEKWINGPPTPGVVCEYLIDWIQFTPAK